MKTGSPVYMLTVLCQLRFHPHISGYFWNLQLFLSRFKPSLSTCGIFKSNSLIHTRKMVSRFILEKLGLHIVLPCWLNYSVRDWTWFCYVIGLKNIQIHCTHAIRFVADLFFPLWRADQKNRICCRFCRTHVDRSCIQNERVTIQKYPDMSGWGIRMKP